MPKKAIFLGVYDVARMGVFRLKTEADGAFLPNDRSIHGIKILL